MQPGRSDHQREPDAQVGRDDELIIDCDRCSVRGHGCHDCMVSVLLGGPPPELESAADGRPRLRLVPVEPLDPVGTDPVRPSGTEPASTDSASDADESGGDGQRAG